ncbi:hypothetical protein FACS189428_0130 [Clostridia bacterium]|nr:hypothetical protein FACS189428_0130 [Clostridia bacterium]
MVKAISPESSFNDSVISNVAEVALGCGAKTVTGGWLKFMCYNLGATDFSKDPFVYDEAILGGFHQWGRPGAASRDDSNFDNFTVANKYPLDWKVPNGYSALFTDDLHPEDNLWRTYRSADDPCPTGWHVPSHADFESIFSGTPDAIYPEEAIANTWILTGSGGTAISRMLTAYPDGSTKTLAFPYAGRRSPDGSFTNSNGGSYLWTSSLAGSHAIAAELGAGRLRVATATARAYALSIRCVPELQP